MNNMKNDKHVFKALRLAFIVVIALCISFATYSSLRRARMKNNEIVASKETLAGNSTLGDSIVNFGMQYLGTPYVSAGRTADGFDCSGFVYFVFQHYNIKVPRSSIDYENFGKEIPIDEVQKGDVLLFLSPTQNVIGHIGIVSTPKGRQSDFIHATSGRQMKVVLTNLTNKGYTNRFVKAIRVI
jgi:cell wall-associated NlpC family hydrolase